MSNNEYYLAEAERKIAQICKEQSDWNGREEALQTACWMGWLLLVIALVGFVMEGSWWSLLPSSLMAVLVLTQRASHRRCEIRNAQFSEQLDRAIGWRDELKRQQRGF